MTCFDYKMHFNFKDVQILKKKVCLKSKEIKYSRSLTQIIYSVREANMSHFIFSFLMPVHILGME